MNGEPEQRFRRLISAEIAVFSATEALTAPAPAGVGLVIDIFHEFQGRVAVLSLKAIAHDRVDAAVTVSSLPKSCSSGFVSSQCVVLQIASVVKATSWRCVTRGGSRSRIKSETAAASVSSVDDDTRTLPYRLSFECTIGAPVRMQSHYRRACRLAWRASSAHEQRDRYSTHACPEKKETSAPSLRRVCECVRPPRISRASRFDSQADFFAQSRFSREVLRTAPCRRARLRP